MKEFNLPVSIRSLGHYMVPAGWRDIEVRKNFVEIFWGQSGCGEFFADDKVYHLVREMAFLYFTGDTHVVRASSDWEYRWIAFDGPLAESIVRGFGFESRLIEAGPCPVELFEELYSQVVSITLCGQKQALATGFNILCCIGSGSRHSVSDKSGRLVELALKIIDKQFCRAEFDVNSLTEMLGVHRSTLYRAFEQVLHISPIQYLKALRVQKALLMVRTTRLTMSEIASYCGFASADYFSRCIHASTGMNPSMLRRREKSKRS